MGHVLRPHTVQALQRAQPREENPVSRTGTCPDICAAEAKRWPWVPEASPPPEDGASWAEGLRPGRRAQELWLLVSVAG
jgi:hypothetical protein